MPTFKPCLPVFLALSTLAAPLALRADPTDPAQTATLQTADLTRYTNVQPVEAYTLVDDTAVLTEEQPAQVSTQPVQAHPIDNTGTTDQPVDPAGPGDTAVTPEPSSLLLLATGMLSSAMFWLRRHPLATLPC